MVSKLTKNPEKRRTGIAVTGPTNVATWKKEKQRCLYRQPKATSGSEVHPAFAFVIATEKRGS